MATRRETQLKRQELRQYIAACCQDDTWAPGDVLPPLQELSRRFQLSVTLTSQVIKDLAEEGLVVTMQGAGTRVRDPRRDAAGVLLMVLPEYYRTNDRQMLPLMVGFEERVSQLGGTCLTLAPSQLAQFEPGTMDFSVRGIFAFESSPQTLAQADRLFPGVPRVVFGEREARPAVLSTLGHVDWIYFDNVGSGYQATRHLQDLGHRDIAYLGLHGWKDQGELFDWSRLREEGWRRAMAERSEGRNVGRTLLRFSPERSALYSIEQQREEGELASRQMLPYLRRGEISAVVAVNCHAAAGLFRALHHADIAAAQWPAVICFGEASSTGEAPAVVSEMRMPWDGLGKEAADLLWNRSREVMRGVTPGQSRQVLVPLRLISRLSCRVNWPSVPGAVSQLLAAT